MTMPAGTYYIGDLCYVMNDKWDRVCAKTIDESSCLDGEFVIWKDIRFALYGTAYGDGKYYDQNHNSYGVDSGSIGCIALKDISEDEIASLNLGHVHTFDEPFTTSSDGGVIRFGNVVIDTFNEFYEEEYLEEDDYLP